jgi:hypothetical protein
MASDGKDLAHLPVPQEIWRFAFGSPGRSKFPALVVLPNIHHLRRFGLPSFATSSSSKLIRRSSDALLRFGTCVMRTSVDPELKSEPVEIELG